MFNKTIKKIKLDNYKILFLLILSVGAFLRFYELSEIMTFISDIGWFYISARDLIINHEIPLVGIESSRPWLHQGAIWTYILAIILWISNFNPVAPAYITALIDIATLLIVFVFSFKLFGKNIGLISSLFYATSPLIITSAQTPYHTSLIPFFTILLIVSVYKWIKGNALFFPICIFLLALLYNLEIATFALTIVVFLIFFYALFKKKNWIRRISKIKILFLSIFAFLIPMTPMLIYDINHGFPQTVKFIAWVFYRIAIFFGFPPVNPNVSGETWTSFFSFISNNLERIYFMQSQLVAIPLLIIPILFLVYRSYKYKFENTKLNLIFLFILIPALGYLTTKTNSSAYLPMFFPQLAIISGYFFGAIKGKYFYISLTFILFVVSASIYNFSKREFSDVLFEKRIGVSREIVNKAEGRNYNILNTYWKEQPERFVKNYEYLTWWLGNGPSKDNEKLKYFITEDFSKIKVEE